MSHLRGQPIGRYQLIDMLGEGGMATVYKALDTRLDRHVAVKVITSSQQSAEEFLKRFEREAKALAQLSHANIIKVHDYGEDGGRPYLVMEYLTEGTLKEKMGRPMPYQEAARLLSPIARALEYAHKRNIVHRDVKPANVLFNESGSPMLTDFGIAKVLEEKQSTELTAAGVGIGTPEYMAPEQGKGVNVDYRADIYALGIVFYELVSGQKPFTADTPMAVVIKHITEPLPPPRQVVPDLPEAVEKMIYKAVAKTPEARYQDMGEFAATLEGLAQRPVAVEQDEIQTAYMADAEDATHIPMRGTGQTVKPAAAATGPQAPAVSPGRKSRWWIWALAGGGLVSIIVIVMIAAGGLGLALLLAEPTATATQPPPTSPPTTSPSLTSPPPTLPPPTTVPSLAPTQPPDATAPQPVVIYQDNFSDPNSGWEASEYEYGDVGYGSGFYYVTSNDVGMTMWGAAFRQFTDTVIDVDTNVAASPDNNNNDYGVVCRMQEEGDGYYLLISGDGYYAILRNISDTFTNLVDWSESSVINQGKASNHIQAVCNGSSLTLIVNGQQLAQTSDSTFPSGDIGLTATTYEELTTAEVHFTNLIVSQP